MICLDIIGYNRKINEYIDPHKSAVNRALQQNEGIPEEYKGLNLNKLAFYAVDDMMTGLLDAF